MEVFKRQSLTHPSCAEVGWEGWSWRAALRVFIQGTGGEGHSGRGDRKKERLK